MSEGRGRHLDNVAYLENADGLFSEDPLDWIKKLPEEFQERRLKACKGELSPMECIAEHCKSCTGMEGVINGIRNCHLSSCPLYFYRPYQTKRLRR